MNTGYIHEQADWPGLHWDSAKLADLLASVRHRQGRLLGRMEGIGFTLRAEASLGALTSEVVKSSAIEGARLDAAEVRSSLARRLGMDAGGTHPTNRDVEAVVSMMLDATQNFAAPLTDKRLFGWHAALFPVGFSGMHQITTGAYRTGERGEMQVVSGPIHDPVIHFQAPAAGRLAAEMTAFLRWFNQPHAIDPLLVAAVAHFWFVTIHPFDDGNGRIARAVAEMALARADAAAQRYYSMSAQIESERKDYYLALERSQRGETDITEWIEWFLGCFGRAIDSAEALLSATLRKARFWEMAAQFPLNERQRRVLNRLLDGFEGKLTSPKYAKLAKCSVDSALRDIRSLQNSGLLLQNPGSGKNTNWSLPEL